MALLGELDIANCRSRRVHQQGEGAVGWRSDPAIVSIGCSISDRSVRPRLMQSHNHWKSPSVDGVDACRHTLEMKGHNCSRSRWSSHLRKSASLDLTWRNRLKLPKRQAVAKLSRPRSMVAMQWVCQQLHSPQPT
ncbi:hypothetical protein BHM03_00056160 [Ensete ventricosum]|nr:hypothetical protein BHM03_00056160 [Ensete ventricosum]